MTDNNFDRRRNALEETFFGKRNYELLEQMRQQLSQQEQRDALSAASGVTDAAVLDHLVACSIEPATLAAIAIVPLVQVAWADGSVQKAERDAVMKAAAAAGVQTGDPSSVLLEHWLTEKPGDELFLAWQEYIGALGERMDTRARQIIRDDIVTRTRQVASAAGGFLGMQKISAPEQAVLDAIEKTFD
ncbi:hypothetical protein [Lignipirellula cremea]|uniref:Tellurite resistance protein TerB n=1 Tax=Lignipirellula cremea TaxID=2528010 RepID=A0A518DMQ2_9BACT|nr:hypothetical protein [Lignipirellula cremea]QDU93116.1 hypothetical protein Pla8534_08950 [Lignipirellula cremea]